MGKKVLAVSEHDLCSKGGIQHVMNSIQIRLCDEFIFDAVSFSKMSENEKAQFSGYHNIFTVNCDSNSRIAKCFENMIRPFKLLICALNIVKKGHYDAVHVHDTLKGGWFLFAAKMNKVPVRVMHCHNPESRDPKNFLMRLYCSQMKKMVNKCSNVKIGCSEDACKSIFGNNSHSFVVNNETDMQWFNPANYPPKNNEYRFVHVGRFTYQKNHEFLLKVFEKIHKKIPNACLDLVGWGQLENDVKHQISEAGLSECVNIYSGNSDVAERMSRGTYMIFPSRYEGLGRVLIEAQIMNVMCFASDCIPKETDLGLCEYLSLEKGVDYWANYIIDFINNNEIVTHSLNNDKAALFDIDNIINTYSEIYRGEHN